MTPRERQAERHYASMNRKYLDRFPDGARIFKEGRPYILRDSGFWAVTIRHTGTDHRGLPIYRVPCGSKHSVQFAELRNSSI